MNDATIRAVRPAPDGAGGFTLSAVMHNEIYFLPAFLEHYRNLGVQHFALLDDRSDDGSTEYAVAQSDVTLFQSNVGYGTEIEWSRDGKQYKSRAIPYMRQLLMEAVGKGQWSTHVDLDEFIDLPEGETLPRLTQKVGTVGNTPQVIWGAMIDMYPASLDALKAMSGNANDDFKENWYFDGEAHLNLSKAGNLQTVYPGARARLFHQHKVPMPREKILKLIKRMTRGKKLRTVHNIKKPILLNWHEEMVFESCHKVKNARGSTQLLPIRHYKFTPSIFKKIDFAKTEKSYHGDSMHYDGIMTLIEKMAVKDSSFLSHNSILYTGYKDFADCGIAWSDDKRKTNLE